MPVRNEAAYIERSLGSILKQDFPPTQMEILIADGMSNDDTLKRIRRKCKEFPNHSVVIVENPDHWMPHGFNRAFQYSKGDIIIIIGGHCELAPDYLSNCVSALMATNADCVGGLLHTVGETEVGKIVALAQSTRFGVGGVAFRDPSQKLGRYVDTVAFGAYRRSIFNKIGLFDVELIRNQDDEFNFRILQANGKIWLDPAIHATYYSRSSLRKLWLQYFQYGLYKVRVIQKRGAIPSIRHLVPAMFVMSLLLSLVIGITINNTLLAGAIGIVYIILNLLVSLWTCINHRRILPLLPIVFVILHGSYGLGFISGLWRWRNAWR